MITKEKLIELSEKGLTIKAQAQELNANETTIKNYRREYNLSKCSNRRKTIITKKEMRDLLDQRYTIEQLAKHFNCGTAVIKRNKRELGLVGYKTNESPLTDIELEKLKGSVDSNLSLIETSTLTKISTYRIKKYLDADSYKKLCKFSGLNSANNLRIGTLEPMLKPSNVSAYVLGYLVGDGNIDNRGCVSAVSIDLELIYYCAKFFKTGVRTSLDSSSGKIYSFSVGDCRFLDKFKEVTNLKPAKTYKPYNIPLWVTENMDYFSYFIVGLFNADGWAYKIDDHRVELGIVQHVSQERLLKELNIFLDWNFYYQSTKDTCTLQGKSKSNLETFAEVYLYNEYALARKKLIISSCEDIV